MDIRKTHKKYQANVAIWQMIHDCLAGEAIIKQEGEKYLPFPVPLDSATLKSAEFKAEYAIYLERGHFTEYTSQAAEDIVAGIFRRKPIVSNLPTALEYLNPAALSRDIVMETSAYGRAFALVDYPDTEVQITKLDEQNKGIAAFVKVYNALDVTDWAHTRVEGVNILTKVVLRESRDITDEAGVTEEKHIFRELAIEDGNYIVRLWDEFAEQIGEDITPKASGKTIAEIPGTFIGINSNTSKVSKAPLAGIAATNIKHYQTWAELKHVETYMGHPILNINGAPTGFIKKMKDDDARINVGSSQALVFEGENTSAHLLEMNSNNLIHFKTLDELKQSMVDQGARLRSQALGGGAETAEALKIRNASDISTMASLAGQVEEAIAVLMRFAGEYMSTTLPDSFEIELNKVFIEETADPVVMTQLSSYVAAQQLPIRILHEYLQTTGIIKEGENLEALMDEINAEPDFTTPPVIPEK